jgi:thioredoxin-like negative regulator of GroEL
MISNLVNIDLDNAEETADEAVNAFPKNAELHHLQAVIVGLAAMDELQAAVENSKLDINSLPNMEWAKARIVELYIQSGNKKAASDLLMSILVKDNKDLRKQVNKLKRQL